MQEYTSVWLRKAEPKFGSTLRRHLAEHGEEEPLANCAIARRATVPGPRRADRGGARGDARCRPAGAFRRTLQRKNMMAANYRHIGNRENRLGRHYSRFSGFCSTAFLADQ